MSAVLGRFFCTLRTIPSVYRGRSFCIENISTEATESIKQSAGGRKTKTNKNTFASYEKIPWEEKDDDIVTSEILTAALNHVNIRGWNEDAIRAGARDVFVSEEISGIFREYDLVKFFISSCNKDLENHLSKSLPVLSLVEALEYRLEKVIPYAPNFQQALGLATKPENFPESLHLLLQLSDSIAHHALKDRSTDMSWYTKRMGIASIYVATELYFVQDTSENHKNTFDFLSRRVKDFEDLGNGSIAQGLPPLPDVMSAGFTTLQNILGANPKR